MSIQDSEPTGTTGRLPRMVRYLGVHCALGAILGCLFAALMIIVNVGGLRDLLEASDQPYLPLVMLYIMCALTFASIVMGIAVMSMANKADEG